VTFFERPAAPARAPQRNRPHGNLRGLKVAVFVLFGILVAQLFNLQVLQGEEFARRSRDNHILVSNILPPRGLIYDRNGQPLVRNVGFYTASVTPDFLPEDNQARYRIFLRLEEMFGVPALEIQSLVKQYEDTQPWTAIPIRKYLTHQEALMLEEAAVDMPGVSLTITPGREYIGGNSLSHMLGYIGAQTPDQVRELRAKGYALTEQVGKSGLELHYESELRGQIGYSQDEVDAYGRLLSSLKTVDPVPGSSLKLNIDANLQEYVAEVLRDYQGEAPTAAAVVMNAKTGAIYALVSVPGFDNNIFSAIDQHEDEWERLNEDFRRPLVNHAIADENIPGSVFKLVTASAALQEHVITPETGRTVDSTVLEVRLENNEVFPLIDWRAHGYVNLRSAIAWSSNIYFFMASCGILGEQAEGLGAVRLGTYARLFGFGQRTGIDVDGEALGRVPSPEWKLRWTKENFGAEEAWRYGDTCNMGIGQGYVTSSPLQVARMTAAVANGGYLVTPTLVQEIIQPDGSARPVHGELKRVPVSSDVLQVVREGMRESVAYGAAKNSASRVVAVAGKTGTAEFRQRGDGTYDNHAWYTGFAPADDPEIVVTVFFQLGWGGDRAAPAAARIFDYFFENVQP
jgi:penicillin-binding protein 2